MKKPFLAAVLFGVAVLVPASAGQQQPGVRVNVLNVCTPGETEQKEISAALARIPRRPAFAADFEVARGRSSMPESGSSRWVRIRREFVAASPFLNAQYSFSVDDEGVVETLVLRLRDSKDLLQVAIEQSATQSRPEEALAAAANATRIRLERFGKSSVALARCPNANQAPYEILFRSATDVLAAYQAALKVRQTIPGDLARIEGSRAAKRSEKKLNH